MFFTSISEQPNQSAHLEIISQIGQQRLLRYAYLSVTDETKVDVCWRDWHRYQASVARLGDDKTDFDVVIEKAVGEAQAHMELLENHINNLILIYDKGGLEKFKDTRQQLSGGITIDSLEKIYFKHLTMADELNKHDALSSYDKGLQKQHRSYQSSSPEAMVVKKRAETLSKLRFSPPTTPLGDETSLSALKGTLACRA